MAHLPEGGGDRVAIKDDLRELEARLVARLDQTVTRDDLREELRGFATEDQLKAFATKDDFKAFATKDDLKAFATKDDLKAFATKEEFSELRSDVRALAKEVVDLRRDVTAALVQGEALRAEWRQDLLTYVGRQTLIQVVSILTIVVAAMVFAASLAP
ncbi:hypothetical protein [Euzebya sp.]|uniref:hypothetical protein n=1 Tax=Euzebya sp. TaxID=1971409 RepID=UPI003514044F